MPNETTGTKKNAGRPERPPAEVTKDATVVGPADDELDALIEELASCEELETFTWARFDAFRYPARVVDRIRKAAARDGRYPDIKVRGEVVGRLALAGEIGDLSIQGSVLGPLRVEAKVHGTIEVAGSVDGDIFLAGQVDHYVQVSGAVAGSVTVVARVRGFVEVTKQGVVGSLVLDRQTDGRVRGNLIMAGSVTGDLKVSTPVAGDVTVTGEVGGRLVFTKEVGGVIKLLGAVKGSVEIAPPSLVRLGSVRGAELESEVYVGDEVSIVDCDFRQCPSIDKLALVGAHLLIDIRTGETARALSNPPVGTTNAIPANEMASIYRQLRVNLEKRSNRPAASWFYWGEMDSRRAAAVDTGRRIEWAWLTLYRGVSGYGLKAWLPLAWFAILVVGGAVVFNGQEVGPAGATSVARGTDSVSFTLQSMLSVFRPPDAQLDLMRTFTQVALRLLGPILLAQAALAVRDRVAR